MSEIFRNTKAVGFDMDGTLYPYNSEVSELIIKKGAEIILALKPELGSLESAREFFINESKNKESRYKALESAGHPSPKSAMRAVLESVNADEFVERDDKIVKLIKELSEKKYVYLVTTSPSTVGSKVLRKLGIDEKCFKRIVYGDDKLINGLPKANAIKDVIEKSGISAEEHVYIGDRELSDIVEPKALGVKTIAVGRKIEAADISVETVYDIEGLLL